MAKSPILGCSSTFEAILLSRLSIGGRPNPVNAVGNFPEAQERAPPMRRTPTTCTLKGPAPASPHVGRSPQGDPSESVRATSVVTDTRTLPQHSQTAFSDKGLGNAGALCRQKERLTKRPSAYASQMSFAPLPK